MLSKGLTRVSLVALVAAMLVVVPVADTARAQNPAQGETNFTIRVPKVVVLHYWANLRVDLTTAVFTTFLTGDDELESEGDQLGVNVTAGVAAGTDFVADADLQPSALGGDDLTSVVLHINNAWGVRAMGDADDVVRMTFSAGPSTLTGASSGETIAVSGAVLGDGTDRSTYSAQDDHSPSGMGTATLGGVAMTLNMSTITEADDFEGTWTVSAEVL
jgi:hypothetical protein